MAQTVKNLPAMQRLGFDPWVSNIPWRREWQPTLVILPGEFPGQRNLAVPWGRKDWDRTERLPLSLSDSSLNSFSRRLWFLPTRISCPFAALHLGKPLGNSHSPLTSRPLASLSLPCTWPFTCSPLFLEFLSPLSFPGDH